MGLLFSTTYMVAAATIGHKLCEDLPINPKYYGIEYNPIFFPLNPDWTGETSNAVARVVIIYVAIADDPGYGPKIQALIRQNVLENLKANTPVYLAPLFPGVTATVINRILHVKKAQRHTRS